MRTTTLCKHCGDLFRTVNPLARFCSVRCKKRAWEKLRKLNAGNRRNADFFTKGQNVTPFEFPLPDSPIAAEPGSDARVAAMQERIRLKQQLHHPADVTMDTIPDEVARHSYGCVAGKRTARHVDFVRFQEERRQRKEEGGPRG